MFIFEIMLNVLLLLNGISWFYETRLLSASCLFMKQKDWTEEEVLKLKEKYANLGCKKMSGLLDRSESSIKAKAYILDKKKLHVELLNSLDSEYVTVLTGVPVTDIKTSKDEGFTSVIDKNGNTYSAKIIVDSTGLLIVYLYWVISNHMERLACVHSLSYLN